MKHEKIYYTCDRCGKEIKNIVPANCIGVYNTMKFTEEQITKRYQESSGQIICTVGFNTEHYDLCPVCKKELKNFFWQ